MELIVNVATAIWMPTEQLSQNLAQTSWGIKQSITDNYRAKTGAIARSLPFEIVLEFLLL